MNILMIGGTGVISGAVTRSLLEAGHRPTLFRRTAPNGGTPVIQGDYDNQRETYDKLRGLVFDVVINWICYRPEQMAFDLKLFTGLTGQYVLVSSTVVYRRPALLPMTENAPRADGTWPYADGKLRCERLLRAQSELPYTIARPSHTYGNGKLPMPLAHTKRYWTLADRLLNKKPVIVPGDGTSVWTLTHSSDFARGLLPLLANPAALGEDYHITSSEWLTWNQIVDTLAGILEVEAVKVPIPSAFIEERMPVYRHTLTQDKAHSAIFDNGKRLALAPDSGAVLPYAEGVFRELQYYNKNPRIIDEAYNVEVDTILNAYRSAIVH